MSTVRLKIKPAADKLTKAQHALLLDEVLLQPWFLPQRTAYKIRGLLPKNFWMKMRHYFDDYGCLICESRTNYHSNGLCKRCRNKIQTRLKFSIKRRSKSMKGASKIRQFQQEKIAKQLLAEFVPPRKQLPLVPPSVDPNRLYNPVYAALSLHYEGDPRS